MSYLEVRCELNEAEIFAWNSHVFDLTKFLKGGPEHVLRFRS